jgi:hypothetical protein
MVQRSVARELPRRVRCGVTLMSHRGARRADARGMGQVEATPKHVTGVLLVGLAELHDHRQLGVGEANGHGRCLGCDGATGHPEV